MKTCYGLSEESQRGRRRFAPFITIIKNFVVLYCEYFILQQYVVFVVRKRAKSKSLGFLKRFGLLVCGHIEQPAFCPATNHSLFIVIL